MSDETDDLLDSVLNPPVAEHSKVKPKPKPKEKPTEAKVVAPPPPLPSPSFEWRMWYHINDLQQGINTLFSMGGFVLPSVMSWLIAVNIIVLLMCRIKVKLGEGGGGGEFESSLPDKKENEKLPSYYY